MSTEDRLNSKLEDLADAILNSRSPKGATVQKTNFAAHVVEDDMPPADGFAYRAYSYGPLKADAYLEGGSDDSAHDALRKLVEGMKELGWIDSVEDLDVTDNDDLLEEDEEPSEPEEEDYVMTPGGYLGGLTNVYVVGGKHVGYFHEEEWAVDKIRELMRESEFYPNVWFQDDHGGYRLVNLAEEYPE